MARRFEKISKKPLIIICSEGGMKSSEYYYFRNFKSRDLRIQFSTGNSTDPEGMLKDLLIYIENEDVKSEDNVRIFLLMDTDLNNDRIKRIMNIEKKCNKHKIEIITSSPTFEIWYLMHYKKDKLIFDSSQSVKKELQKMNTKYIEKLDIFNDISDCTSDAIENALYYEKRNKEACIYYANPHSSIYKIIQAIEEFSKK